MDYQRRLPREELVYLIEANQKQADLYKAAAAKHTAAAVRLRRELELLDTPELPNLFPECPQTPSNQAPTESRPSAS